MLKDLTVGHTDRLHPRRIKKGEQDDGGWLGMKAFVSGERRYT